jgi:hypothetical protein
MGHAGHGRQGRAQVVLGFEQVGHAGPRTDDLGQGLFDRAQGGGAGARFVRRGVGQVQQAGDLVRPAGGRGDRGGDAGAQQEVAVGIGDEALGGLGEAFLVEVRQGPLLEGLHQVGDGALDQALEVADDLVHGLAARLGFRNGDLLQRVLQVGARRLELFDQIRPVQQFERGGLVPRQPAFQQAADAIAGVGGVEVGRLDAERIALLDILLRLAAVDHALGEDGDRLVLAGVGIERFLADAHGDGAPLLQDVLGRLQRVGAVFRGDLERPLRADFAPDKKLVMDLAHAQPAPGASTMGYKTLR